MKNVILLICFFSSWSAMATDLIGFVDVQKVITSIKEGKNVMSTLEKSYNAKKSQLQKEEEKLKKADDDFKKQASILSEQARMNKGREIQEMAMKLQEKQMQYQKEMQSEEQNLKKPIIEKLRPIIDEVSKTAGVSMTFELGTAPVLYVQNKKDLTEDIIKAYDKKHPK